MISVSAASWDAAVQFRAEGNRRESESGGDQSNGPRTEPERSHEPRRTGDEERDTDRELQADPRAEWLVRVPDRLLQSRCDGDDAEHEP